WWTFIPLYGRYIGLSLSQIGIVVAVLMLPFAFSFAAAEIADRSERMRNVMIGLFISGLSIAALALVEHHTMWTLLAFGMMSMVGYAIILPSLNAMITLLSPKKIQGSATAMTDMMVFCSIIVGSPIIGRMIDVFGWPSTFV